jgi:hypothetical protein
VVEAPFEPPPQPAAAASIARPVTLATSGR